MNNTSGTNIWRLVKTAAIIFCILFLYSLISFLIFRAVGSLVNSPDPVSFVIVDLLVASLSAATTLLYFRGNKMLASMVFFFSFFISPFLALPTTLLFEALRRWFKSG